jgi:hypothetical protein
MLELFIPSRKFNLCLVTGSVISSEENEDIFDAFSNVIEKEPNQPHTIKNTKISAPVFSAI